MNTIAEIIKAHLYINAIDILYTKLDLLEEQFNNSLISYIEYSSSKDAILYDIHCILSQYLCPIDL